MSLDPRITTAAPLGDVRARARTQARSLSAGVVLAIGAVLALLLIVGLIALDYTFDQDAHRLFKLLAGGAAVTAMLLIPRFGLFILPLAVPYLAWMPKIPVPMLNAVNILVFGVFFVWIATRALSRQPVVRGGALAPVIGVFLVVSLLALVRGIALPVTPDYNPQFAAMEWFRAGVPFLVYFMGVSMLRGPADRRRMGWLIALALVAESVTTIVLGGNGSAGRAIGSYDQPNVLGTFLAMFTCVVAALVSATRSWWSRLAVMAGTAVGMLAIFPTLSRGAILAVGAGLVYVTLRSSRVMTAVLLLTMATSPLWMPVEMKERLASTQVEVEGTDEMELEGSAQKRLNTWNIIMKVVAEHPLDGVGFAGLGNVLMAEGVNQGIEGVARSAHNSFLRMLGELGGIGVFAFLWIFWASWKLSLDGTRLAVDRFDRQLAVGLGGAVIALAISCWFGDRFFDIGILGNFFLLCAVVQDQLFEARGRRG